MNKVTSFPKKEFIEFYDKLFKGDGFHWDNAEDCAKHFFKRGIEESLKNNDVK